MSSKTLACFGCSHTDLMYTANYISDRPDLMEPQAEWKWPTLLAKKLDMDLIVYAKCGAGSDQVFENVMKSISEDNPDVLAIYWPQLARVQIYGNQYNPNTINSDKKRKWMLKNQPAVRLGSALRELILSENTYHEKSIYVRWIKHIKIIENMCKNNNIKLMMMCADPPDVIDCMMSQKTLLSWEITEMLSEINKKNWIGWPMFKLLGGLHGQEIAHLFHGDQSELVNDSREYPNGEGYYDCHFNKIGHEILMEMWYEKYQKICK